MNPYFSQLMNIIIYNHFLIFPDYYLISETLKRSDIVEQ